MTIKFKRGRKTVAEIGDLRTSGAVPEKGERVKLEGEDEMLVIRRRWVQRGKDWVCEVVLA